MHSATHLLHIVAVCWLFVGCLNQTANEYCDDDMTACSCPESEEICYFELSVQRLITFTRYVRNTPFGSAGKAHYINDTGELVHIPTSPDRTGCNETNCTQANTADSRTYRTFIGINGRLPAPTLIVYEGQTIVANVVNMLQNEVTTIHWHGLTQFNTPWMDGAGIISQCPIEPGASFRYIFKANRAGTFWYHSHSGFQRADGMAGALVVRDRSDAENYPIDHEDIPEGHTVILLDWQREDATTLFWKGLSKLRRSPSSDSLVDAVPLPGEFEFGTAGADGVGVSTIGFWSGLVNGLGRHPDVDFKNSRLKVFSVQQGTTYRFRIVGSMVIFAFRFSIDGHRFTVIATDGVYIEPVVADYVIIHAGERYDILVTANQTEQANFWMRAETLEARVNFFADPVPLPPYPPLPGHEATAVLHYEGSPVPLGPDYVDITEIPKTCTVEFPCIAVNCPFRDYHPTFNITCINAHQLRQVFPTPPDELPSAEYDEQYFFNFAFETTPRISSINGRSFVSPMMSPQIDPSSLDNSTVCNLDDSCKSGCFCTHKIDIPFNKTIRFVFSATGRRRINRRFTHPIHLHGHHFHVVTTGYGIYNETTGESTQPTEDIECGAGSTVRRCINPTWKNGSEPQVTLDEYTIRKDTVIMPGLGYVVVHFKSTNPGWWLVHCHLMPHHLEGMALVVNEAEVRQPPPPAGICDRGSFTWTVEDFNEALNFTYTPPTLPSTDTMPTATPTDTLPTLTPTDTPTATQMAPGPSQTPTEPSTDTGDDELSADAIAGITVGVVVFVAACIALVLIVAIIYVARGAVCKPEKKEADKEGQVWANTTAGGEEAEMTQTQTTE